MFLGGSVSPMGRRTADVERRLQDRALPLTDVPIAFQGYQFVRERSNVPDLVNHEAIENGPRAHHSQAAAVGVQSGVDFSQKVLGVLRQVIKPLGLSSRHLRRVVGDLFVPW